MHPNKDKYKINDISVLIPTYNRADDISKTLLNLKKTGKGLKEIMIIDQSTSNETEKAVKNSKMKNAKYYHIDKPSTAIAKNFGVKKASKSSKIICLLDDDISPDKNYFKEILNVYNKHPEAFAVSGVDPSSFDDAEKQGKLHTLIKKLFFLGHYEKDKARIISSYGNTYPLNLKKVINSEWLPGLNINYKKKVFEFQKFDENPTGYNLFDDTDFPYRLFKKHRNGLFITPYAKLEHRVSKIARQPTKKLMYINQADHFYLHFKNFRSLIGDLKFVWSVIGITALRTLNFVVKRDKNSRLKLGYFYESLAYVIKNLGMIRRGKVREF